MYLKWKWIEVLQVNMSECAKIEHEWKDSMFIRNYFDCWSNRHFARNVEHSWGNRDKWNEIGIHVDELEKD